MKIVQTIKNLFNNLEINKLTLWLIIIGLLLFIGIWLLLEQLNLQTRGWQLLLAIFSVLAYVLLLILYKIFNNPPLS